ncbi:uncharacterized protein LOC130495668 [Raphanus sativus]|uniref:Uncharacterized protein LOC130495668 n=1 Tax=Raphanus sativus TaxID=3726 RepID=A0A9W3BV19_RAPSA|nr:uncharacterized protein LOC130495668 [Raphanus sativus]
MDNLDFPPRMYTVGQEPVPGKSIAYYSDNSKLFTALKQVLNEDEWEELKNSTVGVFLNYQLDCKKKYELWSLVGVRPARFSLHEFEEITGLNCKYVKNLENPLVEVTDEMRAFWGKMGVHFDRGPRYLAIYAGFIQAPRSSSPTCASLARLVMDLEDFKAYLWGRVAFKFLMDSVKAGFGDPIEGTPTPPLLAYSGNRGKRYLKENIVKQTLGVGRKSLASCRYKTVDKCEGGNPSDEDRRWSDGAKQEGIVTFSTESEGVSCKKARQSPGLDVEIMKAEIAQWLTGLTSTMVEELSTVKNTLKTQSSILEGLTAKMGHLEKIVQDGTSADVSNGAKDKEDISEESRSEEASPKPARMTTRAKGKDAQATVSENGNGDISVVVVDKDQIVRAASIVACARSDRQRRLAATQQSLFAGNSTAKVIIPNQPYRGLKWQQKVKGSSSFWFYTLLTPTKWLNDTVTQSFLPVLTSPHIADQIRHGRRRHIVIWDSDVSYAKDEEIAEHVKPFAHMVPYMLHMMSCGEERELYTGYFTHERVSASEKIKTIRSQLASEIFDETSINGTEKRVYNHLGVYD